MFVDLNLWTEMIFATQTNAAWWDNGRGSPGCCERQVRGLLPSLRGSASGGCP